MRMAIIAVAYDETQRTVDDLLFHLNEDEYVANCEMLENCDCRCYVPFKNGLITGIEEKPWEEVKHRGDVTFQAVDSVCIKALKV